MGFDMDDLLRMSQVPPELTEPEPLVIKAQSAPTYDDLMAMLRKVEEDPWGWGARVAEAPDVFEDARRGEETRTEAKTRVMLEAYSLEGGVPRDSDLWRLRAQYVRVRQYVQGLGEGKPYSTDNWYHFYNRYGAGGAREAVLMVGLRVDTVAEMGRMSMIESQSLWAMRLLGH